MKRTVYIGLVTLVLLAAFFLRIQDLQTMPRGIHNDEATNIIWAWRWQAGYGMPFYYDSRPEPFDSFVRAGWGHAAGLTPFAQRSFNILLGMLGIAGCIGAARQVYRRHPHVLWIALVAGVTLATIPANAIINRSIYRANWVIAAMGWALFFIVRALHKRQLHTIIAAGVFSALTATFYLSGLAFLPAMAAGLLLTVLFDDRLRKALRLWHVVLFGLAIAVTMLPWAYLYLSLPNWLGGRIDALQPVNPLESPATAWAAFWAALRPVIAVDPNEWENIRYNTLTASFLTLPQTFFAVLGVGWSVWMWRRAHHAMIVLIGVFAVFPAAFSGDPDVVIRTVSLFVPLSLLVGVGAGVALAAAQRIHKQAYILGVGIFCLGAAALVGHTHYHIRYHYETNPRIHDAPNDYFALNPAYHLGYYDFAQAIRASDTPIYVPTNLLNENLSALLRPDAFPIVRGYDGSPLPTGEMWIPPVAGFDFPPLDVPTQYALFLPDEGTVVLLPPLTSEVAVRLFEDVRTSDDMLLSAGGWAIAHRWQIDDPANQLAAQMIVPETDTPIGIFDDTLTLLDVQAPRDIEAGSRYPVTLFWRIEQPTNAYYIYAVQPLDYQNQSQGTGQTWFYRWFYPTSMWEAGMIIPTTLWVTTFDKAPSGAYRYIASVLTPPTFAPVDSVLLNPADSTLGRSLVAGRSVLDYAPDAIPLSDPTLLDVMLGAAIRLDAGQITTTDTDMTVSLLWGAVAIPDEDYTIFVHVEDAAGTLIAQRDVQPLNGQYPTGHWQIGDSVTTRHTFSADEMSNCPCTVYAGMYLLRTGERLPVLDEALDRVQVGTVTLP